MEIETQQHEDDDIKHTLIDSLFFIVA